MSYKLGVLNLINDSFERLRIVQGKISKNLTVDFDTSFMNQAHQFGIRKVFEASGSVDTLNPQSAEVTFLVFTVAVSIGKTFFPSILGNGPYIAAAAIITSCKF